jgi:hypothetical protein
MDTLTATTLAAVLDEPEVALLAEVLRVLGHDRVVDALVETLTVEAAGGRLTHDDSSFHTNPSW